MSLTEQLAELKKQSLLKTPENIQAIMQDATKRLSESELEGKAPKTGEKLRNFTLSNQLGKERKLDKMREKGPVVVTFYRGGWCPYCNLELRAYQAVLQDIKAAGATLVAITPELPDASLSTSEKNELEFEVLSDSNSDYARELGLIFTLPEELRSIYASFGIDVEKHNGKGQFDLPLAATFIVGVDGIITSAFVNADYTLRKEPAEIVKELLSHVS